MKTNWLQFFGVLTLLVFMGFITACDKDSDVTAEVDNFVEQSTFEIEERSGVGMNGCYELVFPVTLEFADGTTEEVGSYAEMREAIHNWFMENAPVRPRPITRPQLQMPFDVINQDGELITIENRLQLMELRQACVNANYGPNHNGHRPRACFRPVFPFSVAFPDGTQVEVNDPMELRQAVRQWNADNPGTPARPAFVYPLTVELRDGTQVVVNSAEELRALKQECRNG